MKGRGYLRYRRLSDLVHIGGAIVLECQQCQRRAWLAAFEIWQFTGCDRPLTQLKFRCRACGSRRINATVERRISCQIRKRWARGAILLRCGLLRGPKSAAAAGGLWSVLAMDDRPSVDRHAASRDDPLELERPGDADEERCWMPSATARMFDCSDSELAFDNSRWRGYFQCWTSNHPWELEKR